MSNFLNDISIVVDYRGYGNSSAVEPCRSTIGHYKFNQFALIPSVLITLLFTITKYRRNVLRNLWNGRPGLVFPMDTLTRSSRISYACAFGATAFLVYEIVLDQKYAIKYEGSDRAVKSFIAMGSMFIYGMVFFPIFTSLAIGSVYGYTIGALYVWMLTAVQIYKIFECQTASLKAKGFTLLRVLPSIVCLAYLSVNIPFRLVVAFRRGHYFSWAHDGQVITSLRDIRASYAGHYVTKLFRKPEIKPLPTATKDKLLRIVRTLVHRVIYKRKRGFRYPARIISVLITAVIVIYMLTFEALLLFPTILDAYTGGVTWYIDNTLGSEEQPGESQETTDTRTFLYIAIWAINVVRTCIIVSTVLATFFALLNVLHTLSSYRANLLALYKGDHSHIPPASNSSNISHCISSIKYAGFQVGYIIWGYVIQLCIFVLLSVLSAIVVLVILYDFTYWIIFLLQLVWPVVLTMVIVMVVQYLLARFVFLQDRGQYLALDNRSVYFNFTYFMFFYNIFLGLVSCVVRILKATLLGIAFLSRLDNSTLSRRFEFMDPGFKAYIGYMHLEAEHTHPVLNVFCRLMLLGLSDKWEREEKEREKKKNDAPTTAGPSSLDKMELVIRKGDSKQANCFGNDSYDDSSDSFKIHIPPTNDSNEPPPPQQQQPDNFTTSDNSTTAEEEQQRRRRVAARFNWHVTYTLLHNPDIRVLRKGYMQMLRQARLVGVHVPVSDCQGDVNVEQLQRKIVTARESLYHSNNYNKKKTKTTEGGKKDTGGLEEEEAVVTVGDYRAKRPAVSSLVMMSSPPAGVLASRVNSQLGAASGSAAGADFVGVPSCTESTRI